MTVANLLARMSARELAEWRAWFELEAKERDRRAAEARLEARAGEGVRVLKARRCRR
jgi:hypothetical protein